jgi:hypothetical protein
MKNKIETDTITVYWAPGLYQGGEFYEQINMLYPEPENMFSYLKKNKSNFDQRASFLTCPALRQKMQKTFMFKNSLDVNFLYETDNAGNVSIKDLLNFPTKIHQLRPPTLTFGPTVCIETPYLFFSSSEIEASFSMPTFHPAGFSKYGSIAPGTFDIGQWFRPYPVEIQMWNNSGELIIKENEPIFYVEFLTKKKIKLVRFECTQKLALYATQCVQAPRIFGKNLPLITRYDKFKQSKMHDLILKEIKENIVGESNG